MNSRSLVLTVSLAFMLGAAHVALARGGGGAGGAPGGRMDNAGGMSSGHMSEAGKANTNAQFLPDSQRGLDRAEERMNEHGLDHEQATKPHKQSKKKPEEKSKIDANRP
ncbi:MAG: hypothetical protein HY274_00235 [Gammaproteobacteria bacterium]|nr:hypothetical protein [Gammaproteobacteria bacterium]